MKKRYIIGGVVLVVGLAFLAFWSVALKDWLSLRPVPRGAMTKSQFEHKYPALNAAFKYLDYTPFDQERYANMQQPPGFRMRPMLLRHVWLWLAAAFLGGSILTCNSCSKLWGLIHYACVVAFGGAIFTAISLTNFAFSWYGK